MELENYLHKLIRIETNETVLFGEIKRIDDDQGALIIKEKDAHDLKAVLFTDIIHCELADSSALESKSSEILKDGPIFESKENLRNHSNQSKPVVKFNQMTSQKKKELIKENLIRYGPSKDASSHIAAIYAMNYLNDRLLNDNTNMKICIIIGKTDWSTLVALNISRILATSGYDPQVINHEQRNSFMLVTHYLYASDDTQRKVTPSLTGNYELAIVATDNATFLKNDNFRASNFVFIGVPQNTEVIKTNFISALFFGPFDQKYFEFGHELVFVQSGMSRKSLKRIGIDVCPISGYIIHQK
ncbi:hypothetical protein M153_2350006266 [Pseudoloma neurophilia]|uniref:DUF5096 domain-containing protein n=1 Tax=Pseudoloma neurophilia TaxID=146866 RepID=A0A0R0M4K5_9MICR|nr:hypothetical protein M153_2350006266 [Pseudoloma neurophilia]